MRAYVCIVFIAVMYYSYMVNTTVFIMLYLLRELEFDDIIIS